MHFSREASAFFVTVIIDIFSILFPNDSAVGTIELLPCGPFNSKVTDASSLSSGLSRLRRGSGARAGSAEGPPGPWPSCLRLATATPASAKRLPQLTRSRPISRKPISRCQRRQTPRHARSARTALCCTGDGSRRSNAMRAPSDSLAPSAARSAALPWP